MLRWSKESLRRWLQLNSRKSLEGLPVDNSDFCSSVQLEVDRLSFQKFVVQDVCWLSSDLRVPRKKDSSVVVVVVATDFDKQTDEK